MTCKGRIASGTIYATATHEGVKVVGYIRKDDEMPLAWVCDEIVLTSDRKLTLSRSAYDEVTEETDHLVVATYSGDDCAVASFERLFAEPRYDDFKALWAYIYAKAKTSQSPQK
jgi:hypothetical protein